MAQEISTDDAFETLVSKKLYWEKTGLPDTRRRQFLSYLKTGARGVPMETKIKMLQLAGFGIIQQMTWVAPAAGKPTT